MLLFLFTNPPLTCRWSNFAKVCSIRFGVRPRHFPSTACIYEAIWPQTCHRVKYSGGRSGGGEWPSFTSFFFFAQPEQRVVRARQAKTRRCDIYHIYTTSMHTYECVRALPSLRMVLRFGAGNGRTRWIRFENRPIKMYKRSRHPYGINACAQEWKRAARHRTVVVVVPSIMLMAIATRAACKCLCVRRLPRNQHKREWI